MKTCTKCLLDKDRSEYYTKDGGRLHAECKACFIKRKQESYYDKKKFVQSLVGTSCTVCGYDRTWNALELHHKDPNEKEFGVSRMWGMSEKKIEKEVAKCVLLCSNCHREVHAGLLTV